MQSTEAGRVGGSNLSECRTEPMRESKPSTVPTTGLGVLGIVVQLAWLLFILILQSTEKTTYPMGDSENSTELSPYFRGRKK